MTPLALQSDTPYGIRKTSYYFSKKAPDLFQIASLDRKEFHADGANLTIAILQAKDARHSIKLLSSLEYYAPVFKGQVFLFGETFAADQELLLTEFLATSPLPVTIFRLDPCNAGKARKQAAENANTDWLMFVDNEMFFTKNPLQLVRDCIEQLGVNFLNLPLINNDWRTVLAFGGAVMMEKPEDNPSFETGSYINPCQNIEFTDLSVESPFLSDFLRLEACVVYRKNFLEEIQAACNPPAVSAAVDLSLRLYNTGQKIGNINEFALVHNYSVAVGEAPVTGVKKKIALVADVQDWAFHNIAKNIQVHLSHKYDFTIYFQGDYSGEKWLDLYPVLYKKQYDIIFCFWREIYTHFYSPALRYHLETNCSISGTGFEDFLNKTVLLTAVYDHLFLEDTDLERNKPIFTNHVDGYFVSSKKLRDIYEQIDGYLKPFAVIQDGVDTKKFFGTKTSTSSVDQPLVVGWAGNSAWRTAIDGIDHKGFTTIIRPVIAELVREGYNIKLIYADKQEPATHLHTSQMNDFYNSLDVYICTSDIEGTPNPVLESMACGISIISTDVGIVKEVFGKHQQEFILEERTKECLKKKLVALLTNRNLLSVLGKENLVRINHWTWQSKCERFEKFFDYYLHKKELGHLHHKKFPYYEDIQEIPDVVVEPPAPVVTIDLETAEAENEPFVTIPYTDPDPDLYVPKASFDSKQEEAQYWQQNAEKIQHWYNKEYEVLPLWFKRLGHIVKVCQGKRSFRSLISDK